MRPYGTEVFRCGLLINSSCKGIKLFQNLLKRSTGEQVETDPICGIWGRTCHENTMRTTRTTFLVQHQILAALLVVSLWCFRSFCSTEALCCLLDPKAAMQSQEMSRWVDEWRIVKSMPKAKGLNALNSLLLRTSRHQAPWGCQHRPPSKPAEKFRWLLYEITLIHCIVGGIAFRLPMALSCAQQPFDSSHWQIAP